MLVYRWAIKWIPINMDASVNRVNIGPCRLVGAKPSYEPMLTYWQLDTQKQTQILLKIQRIYIKKML